MTVRSQRTRPGVATLTLDRPHRANALDPAMIATLKNALDALDADADVRAIVLCGGSKHFCAGADLVSHQARGQAPEAEVPTVGLVDLLLALAAVSKPVVAMVHGSCIGAGIALVAGCDLVIAAREATFALPELRLGLSMHAIAPFIARAMAPRAIGRWLLTGERFTAAEAQAAGLVHELCDMASAPHTLHRILDGLIMGAPNAVADTKRCLAALTQPHLDPSSLRKADAVFMHNLASAESVEGLAAYFEKRRPSWHPGGEDL